MLDIVFPRVYFGKDGWKFTAVVDSKMVQRSISEYDALGLAESIMAASAKRARPAELSEWDRRVAC